MNRRLLLHIGFWVAYALYDGYLSVPLSGTSFAHLSMGQRLWIGYQAEFVLLTVKIPAVYLVLYRFIPRTFQTKKYFSFALQVLVTVAFVSTVLFIFWQKIIYPHIFHIDGPAPASSAWVVLFRALWSSFDFMMLISVASALKLFRMRIQTAEREKALMEEKLQSELQFLRAQTNPHFLFNTLNNLYHLARKRSEDTPDAILKLSELLRFMLYECSTPQISISRELKVIDSYLDLERLRYGERLSIRYEAAIDHEDQPIAPLLLLPLIENAFKHGASEARGATWVDIFIKINNQLLELKVSNPKDPAAKNLQEGIGLKNVRRQLELVYPEHELKIEDKGEEFCVYLSIHLNHE